MKKGFLFLCCLCLGIALAGCKKDDTPRIDDGYNEARQVAWDLLSEEERETVTHSWEEAGVKAGKFNFWVIEEKNSRRETHYCYRVIFSTTKDGLLGPIQIFLDISTLEYIGTELRF